jgi:hypothetical protein
MERNCSTLRCVEAIPIQEIITFLESTGNTISVQQSDLELRLEAMLIFWGERAFKFVRLHSRE